MGRCLQPATHFIYALYGHLACSLEVHVRATAHCCATCSSLALLRTLGTGVVSLKSWSLKLWCPKSSAAPRHWRCNR